MAEDSPTPRLTLLHEIAAKPFARAMVALLALLGTVATVRELALPEPAQAKLNFYRLWTLSWPWWLWVLVLLVTAVFVLFEGALAAATPRLGWPVNQVVPGDAQETSVFSVDAMLHRIARAVLTKRGTCPELRVPFRVRYSDTKGRTWSTEYAVVYYVGTPRIEDI